MVLTKKLARKLMMMIATQIQNRNNSPYQTVNFIQNLNLFLTCVQFHKHMIQFGQASYICLDACVSPSKGLEDLL